MNIFHNNFKTFIEEDLNNFERPNCIGNYKQNMETQTLSISEQVSKHEQFLNIFQNITNFRTTLKHEQFL